MTTIVKVTKSGTAPTVESLASKLESDIEGAQYVLGMIADELAKGMYDDAVALLQSEFFMGDSDLEHSCERLDNALADEEED